MERNCSCCGDPLIKVATGFYVCEWCDALRLWPLHYEKAE